MYICIYASLCALPILDLFIQQLVDCAAFLSSSFALCSLAPALLPIVISYSRSLSDCQSGSHLTWCGK